MNHQERLLWLAEQEMKCLGVGAGFPDLPDARVHNWCCMGSGKVPRFPTLRLWCDHCRRTGKCESGCITCENPICSPCQGQGWVPVDNLGATLPCAHEWRFRKLENGIWASCHLTTISVIMATGEGVATGEGPSHNEAAILVLYQIMRV